MTYATYGQHMVDGILDYAERSRRWNLELIRFPPPWELMVPRDRWDGLLVANTLADHFLDFDGPKICIGARMAQWNGRLVVSDNIAVGRMAAGHFIELGFENLAFFGRARHSWAADRLSGFEAAANDEQLTVHVQRSALPGSSDLQEWLTRLPKPVGIFTATDADAAYIANLCRMLDLAVPEAVAILGVDNDERLCRSTIPPLSSVDNNAVRLGFEAAALLERLMSSPATDAKQVHHVPPVAVVRRQSTDTLAIADPNVAAAVRFIRENAVNPIDVRAVCRAARMSRRALELSFKRTLNRTIHDEIHRLRVARALELLAWTELPIVDICERSGFSYPSRLATVVRRETGMTPREYRRQHRSNR
jgi:LacI family transcriptional regulator